LLSEDGVIFISIDDNEQANLKLLCDDVFGEGNFVCDFIWKKKQGGGNDSNLVVIEHEYILTYCKNESQVQMHLDKKYKLDDNLYPFHDDKGDYGLITLDKASIQISQSLIYEIVDKEGNTYHPRIVNGKQSCWRWSKAKVEEEFDELVFKNGKVYTKYYRPEGITPKSLLIDALYGRTESGNDDIKKLFRFAPFTYPKPVSLIHHFTSITTDKDSIILDFFAGSGTTAHAVTQLNSEDGGNRKFIMVQLDEPTKEDSEARKAGYNSIDEIARERIKRAGAGFKHYRCQEPPAQTIDKIEKFDPSKEVQGDLFGEMANAFGEETILQTWLLSDGYEFSQMPETKNFAGYRAHYIDGSLYIINQGWGKEQTKELLNLVGKNELRLNHIRIYGYSIDMESLRELKINVSQSLSNVEIELRY